MKKSNYLNFAVLILGTMMLLVSACNKESVNNALPTSNQESANLLKSAQNGAAAYIVILNDDVDATADLKGIKDYDKRKEIMSGYLNRFLNGKGVAKEQVENVYTSVFQGFSVKLSGPQLERLKLDPRVLSIEPDEIFTLGKPAPQPPPPVVQPPQVVSWGVTRVGGPINCTGNGKTAWVIDSGIDLDHPDLNVNRALSKSFISKDSKMGDDVLGHGTGVAGVIGAIDNTIGAVGVAAGVTLVSVRVLNDIGSGPISGITAGVDYVAATAKPGDVANLSLACPATTALDNAVLALGKKGIKVAIAAGNDGVLITKSPGRIDGVNIYTVAAILENDVWASWTSFGPQVDCCAPGVRCVTTGLKAGYIQEAGGTSVSAPHVAGLLLLGALNNDGFVLCPGNGMSVPIAHR